MFYKFVFLIGPLLALSYYFRFFNTVLIQLMVNKICQCLHSNRSTNCATTTAHLTNLFGQNNKTKMNKVLNILFKYFLQCGVPVLPFRCNVRLVVRISLISRQWQNNLILMQQNKLLYTFDLFSVFTLTQIFEVDQIIEIRKVQITIYVIAFMLLKNIFFLYVCIIVKLIYLVQKQTNRTPLSR